MELKERKKLILKAIIDHFINTGMPIGSKDVANKINANISTATIRNEMAALEEMGFLFQPHISSGRIPSDLAYRLYVNNLMGICDLNKSEVEVIKNSFDKKIDDIKHVIDNTVNVLSDITNCVAIALLPKTQNLVIKNIKLVKLTDDKALVVIVTNYGIIKDRVIHFNDSFNESELNTIAEMLLKKLGSISASDIKSLPEGFFVEDLIRHEKFIHQILEIIGYEEESSEIVLTGTQKIFDFPEISDMSKAKALLECIENKEMITKIIKENFQNNLSIIIGDENKLIELSDCSIITSNYTVDNMRGFFGIIGPKRMNYAKMIAILDEFTENVINNLENLLE